MRVPSFLLLSPPSSLPVTLRFSRLRNPKALGEKNKNIAWVDNERYGLYKVEVRDNDVLGIDQRGEGSKSGVNLAENVEATFQNIAIPVTQLDLPLRERERRCLNRDDSR